LLELEAPVVCAEAVPLAVPVTIVVLPVEVLEAVAALRVLDAGVAEEPAPVEPVAEAETTPVPSRVKSEMVTGK
jgi:hypothetical protein